MQIAVQLLTSSVLSVSVYFVSKFFLVAFCKLLRMSSVSRTMIGVQPSGRFDLKIVEILRQKNLVRESFLFKVRTYMLDCLSYISLETLRVKENLADAFLVSFLWGFLAAIGAGFSICSASQNSSANALISCHA